MNVIHRFSMQIFIAATILIPSPARAQVADAPDAKIANIPVNYTEAKVGTYTLPDPLKLANGQAVTDAATWTEKRRPEILKMIEEGQFGRSPARPAEMTFDVTDKGTPAFDGKATRKQVTIYFTKDKTKDYVDVLIYLPAAAKGPVPVLLSMGWSANNLAVSDPGVKVGRTWNARTKERTPATPAPGGRPGFGRLNVLPVIEKGFGIATFNYSDVDPDSLGSVAQGIRGHYLKEGQKEPAPEEWGAIAAWAWGISRIVDYFETDPQIDAKKVAIMGVSRQGKTVLWAGAHDTRIALVLASCSGEGGAALSRRNYGETIAHLVAPTRYPYQFCANYAKYAEDPKQQPFDSHMLVALMAPRPVLLQTGNTDGWSDPKGEFMAAIAAGPVYKLFGKQGLETDKMPEAGQPILHTIGYLMHVGGHGSLPGDMTVFLNFMQMNFKP